MVFTTSGILPPPFVIYFANFSLNTCKHYAKCIMMMQNPFYSILILQLEILPVERGTSVINLHIKTDVILILYVT